MKVSLNTIRQFTTVDLTVDELVTKINQQLGKVDEVLDLAARYEGAVIVKVASCEKHPNADKLNVCQVDDGRGELTQVVCGAPNVHAGMYAVWLKPGSTVPSTASDDEPFVLGARELRGQMSNGMLASPKELGLGDAHDGILEITDDDLHHGVVLAPGLSFSETFGLNDTIINIENKMFTHRPDLFGQLGVAREIAGISGNRFNSPEWYTEEPQFAEVSGISLNTFNDAGDGVPRIIFLPMSGITVTPSPLWLQCALVALGGKPINNVVDATNYIMLLTSQPTHAYDYDKIRGGTIGARMAKHGEAVKLLNGRTYELTVNDIVIADGEGPIGLGGIMGGGESEVTDDTTNIVLEVATFDMYAVRKSSMSHGVFTDALTRFNKGQSPLQNPDIMSHLMKMIERIASGQQAGTISDIQSAAFAASAQHDRKAFSVSSDFINARLGLRLSAQEIDTLLINVEITTELDRSTDTFVIHQPFWRTDLELPEDIVEEVGRLYGFDKLPRELPLRSSQPAPKNIRRELKQKIRKSLSNAGANEVLTYSFVHEKLLNNAGYSTEGSYKLSNAVSPELQNYRTGVLPSLLDKVNANVRNGYETFALFEIGKGHDKGLELTEEDLPRELEFVDIVYTAKKPRDGAALYHVRRMLDKLADDLDMRLSYAPNESTDSTNLFEPSRSAFVTDTVTGAFIGIIGEFKPAVVKKFKLPAYSSGATLQFEGLAAASAQTSGSYLPLSKYPSVTQDVSLKISSDVTYSQVFESASNVTAAQQDLHIAVSPLSIYRSADDHTSKTVTLRLKVTSYLRTLTDGDVKPVVAAIAQQASRDFDGKIV